MRFLLSRFVEGRSWNEFELFVEVEYWLSGDFTKFGHYWAGDVTITKPADWPE